MIRIKMAKGHGNPSGIKFLKKPMKPRRVIPWIKMLGRIILARAIVILKLPVKVLNAGIIPSKFANRIKKNVVRKNGSHFSPNSLPKPGYTSTSRTNNTIGSRMCPPLFGSILFVENAGMNVKNNNTSTINIINICLVKGMLRLPEETDERCIGFKKGNGCHSFASVTCSIRTVETSGAAFFCSANATVANIVKSTKNRIGFVPTIGSFLLVKIYMIVICSHLNLYTFFQIYCVQQKFQ
jgi:hypothetical protein